jgi:transcription-repair coupling factor (superfamily II helicase)
MGLYKRMAMIETVEDKEDILDELIDRYGDLPKPVMNLLNIALVRSAAIKCSISSIVEDANEVRIYPENFDMEIWGELSDYFKNRMRVVMGEKISVNFRFKKEENLPSLMFKLFSKYIEFEAAMRQNSDEEEE